MVLTLCSNKYGIADLPSTIAEVAFIAIGTNIGFFMPSEVS